MKAGTRLSILFTALMPFCAAHADLRTAAGILEGNSRDTVVTVKRPLSPTQVANITDELTQLKNEYLDLRARAEASLDEELLGLADEDLKQRIKNLYFGTGQGASLLTTYKPKTALDQGEALNRLIQNIKANSGVAEDLDAAANRIKSINLRKVQIFKILQELVDKTAVLPVGMFPTQAHDPSCSRDGVLLSKSLNWGKRSLFEDTQLRSDQPGNLQRNLRMNSLPLKKEVFAIMAALKVECIQDSWWPGDAKVEATYDSVQHKLILSEDVEYGISKTPGATEVADLLKKSIFEKGSN